MITGHRNQRADTCVLEHAKDPDRPRRALDGLYLCAGHRDNLEQLIAEMPARADELERSGRVGGPRPPGAHSEICVDDAISTHRTTMTGVVASWCRVVAEDRGVTPPRSAELHHTCPWLLPHVDWCAANRWVDEMLLELRAVNRKALHLVDIPARKIPLGVQCMRHEGGERCAGLVTLIARADDWTVRCPVCATPQDDVTPYLRAIRRDVGVTEDDVIMMAAKFGLAASSDVVRQWKHRGKIQAQSIAGVIWYDLASVTGYLARRKAQRESVSA